MVQSDSICAQKSKSNNFLLYNKTKEFIESKYFTNNNFNLIKEFFTKNIFNNSKDENIIKSCYISFLLDNNEINIDSNNNNSICINEESKCFLSFDKLINGNVIINPKNYFLKKIFSNIFKDVIFKDRKFQKLKNLYISRYSDKLGFFIKTKQLNIL